MPRAYISPLLFASLLVLGCGSSDGVGDTPRDPEAFTSTSQGVQVCADGETVGGIDVSKWQGTINWDAVKTSGIGFAIARVSHGTTYIDEQFDANWAGIKAQGLVRGVYQYYAPDEDPIAQADILINAVGSLGPMDLPPVIDVEETGGASPSQIIDGMHKWLDHVEAALGKKPMIYTGKYFWQDNVATPEFSDYPLWIPNYSYSCPDLADNAWTDWVMFQYSSTGSVPGISGNVDMNYWNGSQADLIAFAGAGGADYAAQFVSQSFPYASQDPLQVMAGTDLPITITLKNTGKLPWDEKTRLATTMPRDRESPFAGDDWPGPNRYDAVEGTVMPGEEYTFSVVLHAPKELGVYDEHFGLVQEGVTWFSDEGQGGPPDDQLEGMFEVIENPNIGSEPDVVGEPSFAWAARFKSQTSSQDGGCSAAPTRGSGAGFGALAALGALVALRRRRR